MLEKWDGHTHTSFCKHGNDAELNLYLNRAIALGFHRYTITEHPPLPSGWVDNPELMMELAMSEEELAHYMAYATHYKRTYEEQLQIHVGLELDYLHRREDFTLSMVDRLQDTLEDVVVSVHFLPGKDGMRCIDFTAEDFCEGLLAYYGSMDQVVDEYFHHVHQAIELAAQLPMRKRIGHLNLIEKFRLTLPDMDPSRIDAHLQRILPLLVERNIGVDVNTAGLRVGTCGKPYVPVWFLQECLGRGIECVFGSDAHRPEHVGAGWEWVEAAFTNEG